MVPNPPTSEIKLRFISRIEGLEKWQVQIMAPETDMESIIYTILEIPSGNLT